METLLLRRPLNPLLRRGKGGLTATTTLASSSAAPLAAAATSRSFASTPCLPKATSSRMKRHLNVAPHTSFLAASSQETSHIVFNPPSSAPSVFNTPFKFLPKCDPRRHAALASHLFADPSSPIPSPLDIANALANSSSAFASSLASSPDDPPSARTTFTGSPPPNQGQQGQQQGQDDQPPVAGLLPPAIRKDELLTPKFHLTPTDVEEIRRLRIANPAKWSVHKLAYKFSCSQSFVMSIAQATDSHQKKLKLKAAEKRARWGTIKKRAKEEQAKRTKLLMAGKI